MLRKFENTDYQTRVWPDLVNPLNGQTLELKPGEQIELDLDDKFEDAYLKPVAAAPAPKAKAKLADPLD